MVRRDVPMKTVADLPGHARLETTTIYAKLALRRAMPVWAPSAPSSGSQRYVRLSASTWRLASWPFPANARHDDRSPT